MGIKAFQLFHCFLGKGPREGEGGRGGGRERRREGKGEKEEGRERKGKKGEEEEGRGREGCEFTMNIKYSDITQHTHSSSC